MLADLNNSTPPELVTWLGCAAFLIVLVNGGMKLVERVRGERAEPPNRQLDAAHANLSRRVDGQAADIAELRREFRKSEAEHARNDASQRASLYRKIDETRAELEARMEAHRGELSRDIKEMPAQIIMLLKNTDAI